MALTYSITGGADGAKFSIDATTGVLTFKTAPDFEQPGDADHNNVYQVEVGASDGTTTTKQMINVTVSDKPDTNQPPQITSPAAFTVPENQTAVATVTATDPDGGGTQPPIEPPASGDYPNAGNTGAGSSLQNSGSITTNQAGQVVENKKISGTINVMHPNVKIRNCEVNNIISHDGDGTGLLIENCTIVGGSWNSGMSIMNAPNAIVRRCDISGAENGIWFGVKGSVEDNWFHDLASPGNPDPHYDGVQVSDGTRDAVIRHNNFDLGQGGTSSCVTMKDCTNIDIADNRIDGGSYCIYFEGNTSNCDVTGNDFISYTYGWVAGSAAGSQNYSDNTFAGDHVGSGFPQTRKEGGDKNKGRRTDKKQSKR